MMSDDDNNGVDPKVAQGRHRCLVLGIIIVALLAIAAIVLPFVIDTCDDCKNPVPLDTPTPGPVLQPSGPTRPPSERPPAGGTWAPTTLRLGHFIEEFLESLSGAEVFRDKNSPQYMAAVFLAEEDKVGPTLDTIEELEDRYALTVFYYAMDGNNWFSCYKNHNACSEGSSWLNPDVSHCEWNAISCNDDGRVVDLYYSKWHKSMRISLRAQRNFNLTQHCFIFVLEKQQLRMEMVFLDQFQRNSLS